MGGIMETSKPVRILGYILIGIVLLPIIAIGLFVALGASLFLILYIINRKKNGRQDPKAGKTYKTISTILFFITLLGLAILLLTTIGTVNFLTWQGYFGIQAVVFISMIPMCIYQYRSLKCKI